MSNRVAAVDGPPKDGHSESPFRKIDAMTYKLIVASGKSAGRIIALKREKLLVGRADECDVRPLSEEVSRRHCAFRVEADTLVVEDLRSRNGTFVNGSRIDGRRQLADGDIVRIGNLELKVAGRAAVAPPSHAGAASEDDEVSRWLMADDAPAGMFDTTRSLQVANQQTVPISAEATAKNPAAEAGGKLEGRNPEGNNPEGNPDTEATVVRGRPSPSGAASGPPGGASGGGQKKAAETSRAAAAEALKKFFNNR